MLYYIGKGSFLPGVPARDLSEEEVEKHGGSDFLCSTLLYTTIKPDQLHIEATRERRRKIQKEDES